MKASIDGHKYEIRFGKILIAAICFLTDYLIIFLHGFLNDWLTETIGNGAAFGLACLTFISCGDFLSCSP